MYCPACDCSAAFVPVSYIFEPTTNPATHQGSFVRPLASSSFISAMFSPSLSPHFLCRKYIMRYHSVGYEPNMNNSYNLHLALAFVLSVSHYVLHLCRMLTPYSNQSSSGSYNHYMCVSTIHIFHCTGTIIGDNKINCYVIWLTWSYFAQALTGRAIFLI